MSRPWGWGRGRGRARTDRPSCTARRKPLRTRQLLVLLLVLVPHQDLAGAVCRLYLHLLLLACQLRRPLLLCPLLRLQGAAGITWGQ